MITVGLPSNSSDGALKSPNFLLKSLVHNLKMICTGPPQPYYKPSFDSNECKIKSNSVNKKVNNGQMASAITQIQPVFSNRWIKNNSFNCLKEYCFFTPPHPPPHTSAVNFTIHCLRKLIYCLRKLFPKPVRSENLDKNKRQEVFFC